MTTYPHADVKTTYVSPPATASVLDPEPSKTRLSFDDIPEWCSAYFRDDVWWVVEKGTHVVPGTAGRHMALWSQTSSDVHHIHEGYINGWLNNKSVIHFNVWEIWDTNRDDAEDVEVVA